MNATQTDMIRKHLESGKALTALVALDRYGIFRLAARIKDLRDEGYLIRCENVKLPNGKRIGRYSLV